MKKRTPEELREIFWTEDAVNGGVIRKQYEEIKEVLEKRDMAWVENRYQAIKAHAISTTDYYKGYSEKDDFPVVDKMSILSNYEAHKAREGFEYPTHISSTSGSTGTPFAVIQDFRKRMRTIADLQVFGELCDYPTRERMVFFRVLSEKIRRTSEQEEKENIFYIDSSDLSENHLEEMLQELLTKKPRIVFSYASTLVELARYIASTNIGSEKFTMKSVLTGGEGISEKDRQLLEQVFGCKVYRRYSDMELGILGQDMGEGGPYVLNYGSFYFECLKENSDERAEPGEVGRIVITDLFNYAFPMIRYDTGDLGIMKAEEEGNFPVFQEIYGRKRDCVYATDGRLISPAKISVMMWGLEGVSQWQFIQETQMDYKLKVNAETSIDFEGIITMIKKVIGEDAKIEILLVDEIPVTSSNKRRAVICNYKKED